MRSVAEVEKRVDVALLLFFENLGYVQEYARFLHVAELVVDERLM